MTEISFDTETLGLIRLFEERTGARVKDCLHAEDKIVFLVYPGEIPKAVGPGGAVVDRLKDQTHREIQVVEYLRRRRGAGAERLLSVRPPEGRVPAQGEGPPCDRHRRPGLEGAGHRQGGEEPQDRPRGPDAPLRHRVGERRVAPPSGRGDREG